MEEAQRKQACFEFIRFLIALVQEFLIEFCISSSQVSLQKLWRLITDFQTTLHDRLRNNLHSWIRMRFRAQKDSEIFMCLR
jgi:hypothetical protein